MKFESSRESCQMQLAWKVETAGEHNAIVCTNGSVFYTSRAKCVQILKLKDEQNIPIQIQSYYIKKT